MIIYLNGPSSSGKTTLARALQDALPDPYLHLSFDKMVDFMPDRLNNWKGGPAPLGFSWESTTDPTGHPIYKVHAGPFARKIVRTLKDVALLFASQHYNLIIDDIAFGAIQVDEWRHTLKDYPVLYVGVLTPLPILEQRERSRGDRMLGSARGQYFEVHHNVSYDLELDTHALPLDANVAKIRGALAARAEKK